MIIKAVRITAPSILETVFETRVLKNSTTSNPFGYLHLYLCQGEKNVRNKVKVEKKFAANIR